MERSIVRWRARGAAVGCLLFVTVGGARAQNAPAAPPAPCTAAEYHQFDFWLGRWTVTNPAGKPVGTSVIDRQADGCVVQEHWSDASGPHGTSLNFYERATGKWNQVWVGGRGLVLRLSGGLEGRSMVLSGDAAGPNGKIQHQRLTFTPLDGGRVRQHWESSADGEHWQTVFDGTYTPAHR